MFSIQILADHSMNSRIALASLASPAGPGEKSRSRRRTGTISSSLDAFKLKYQPVVMSQAEFGRDAPMYTISSSNRSTAAPSPRPGPGQYNPTAPDHRLKTRFRTSVDPDLDPLTRGIDMYRHPGIGDKLDGSKNKIHERLRGELFSVVETPGAKYDLPSVMDTRSHKILPRESFIVEQKNIPPPALYDPQWQNIPHTPAYKFSKEESKRDRWITDGVEDTPGPGAYVEQQRPLTGTTIGDKSRKQKRPRSVMEKTLIIERIVVNLSEFSDPEKVKKYATAHPELAPLVREMFEAVLKEKPKDPVEFLRDTYGSKNVEEKPLTDFYEMTEDMIRKMLL